ncbi:MAG: glycosyltransferase N-terminal domain-containing protein [Planctomycetota bacterium]|nr:3-deoxy-D-manno-octulosonic acid transferase [Planctomycetota bacterium]MCX8039400.1 3-deoxy-D-manno-octulosonic acid transferase [Planctomycetota bacterium]MDW8373324.1 glycosyltransferase N-terminal domain-containing protein [Planctomycetota bacterium]
MAAAARARWWFLVLGAVQALGLPLLALALLHRLWVRRRALLGCAAKLRGEAPPCRDRPLVVHGVSLGEVALLGPLLPQLPAPRLLTTTTETGWQGLARYAGERRAFWPFDLPWAVARFLRRTRPRAIVLLEAELWPLMLLAARARGVPVIVLNARLSERSFRRWSRLRPLAKRLIGSLSLVVAQDAAYAARFAALGVPRARVAVAGSLKADMVRVAEPAAVRAEAERLALAEAPPFLIASTSEPEEEPLIAAWRAHARHWPLLIVPRHPERGAALLQLCQRLGVAARRSSLAAAGAGDAIIVDEIGRLAALYGWCALHNGIAIVGGSLGSGRGGQNMLEAAAAGCCTVVGWDTRAQPEPMRLLRAAQAIVELAPATLAEQLAALVADGARRRALGRAACRAWQEGRGALARTLRILRRRSDLCR